MPAGRLRLGDRGSNEVKRSVTVTIDGKQVPLRSEAAPEYLDALAGYVERQITEVQAGKPLNPYRTAILAALNIADELFRERQEHSELKAQVRERCRRILDYVTAIEAAGVSRVGVSPEEEAPPKEEVR